MAYRKRRIFMRYMLGCLSLLIASVICINAQTVDTAILGTVLDSAGAPMSGATVTILQPATGLSRESKTSPEGTVFRLLLPLASSSEGSVSESRKEGKAGRSPLARTEQSPSE